MLPAEVWTLIFSYLTNNNDLIEVSALSKTFYYLCRRNVRFVEKLSHSRTQFSGVVIFDYYKDICLSFAGQLSYALKDYFEEDVFFASEKFIMTELIFNILPFRVFNHLLCYSRGYYTVSFL